jgi:hypothetical protein
MFRVKFLIAIQPFFRVGKPALRMERAATKTRIKGDAANWSLQFERGALGKDPAADVYYDEGRKNLTLSNLTAELVGVIEKELLARVG